jgi:hypothetical protein
MSGSAAVERTGVAAANGLTRRRLVSMTPGSLAYWRTRLISLNSVLRRVPSFVKTVTSTSARSEPINAYSIAVAPESFEMNFTRRRH